jgi:tRNA (guanine-N7-)-methyltransferase
VTKGQQRALERSWPQFGLDYTEDVLIDPAAVFGNDRPTCLEIGFGNGDALAAIAAVHPERNFLGVEVHGPGIGHLLLKLERANLDNVRVLRQDAMDILRRGLPACCLEGVYLLFPDPWPKKRHHKRRIVQPEFITLLARVIRPGGFLHMATDWEDYARHMLATLGAAADFQNKDVGGTFVNRPAERPLTRFEQRGQHLGHGVWDLVFLRR